MYLTSFLPPPALIVGIPAPPLPHIGVSPLKISGIGIYPLLLTLLLALCLTLLLLTTLLPISYPPVRLKKPATIDTILLFSICICLHPAILCQEEDIKLL